MCFDSKAARMLARLIVDATFLMRSMSILVPYGFPYTVMMFQLREYAVSGISAPLHHTNTSMSPFGGTRWLSVNWDSLVRIDDTEKASYV